MAKLGTAGSLIDLNLTMWRMSMEASSVIAMRAMGAAGFWNNATNENEIMLREKQLAFAKGAAQATLALWRGANPAAVMLEAVQPAKARIRSNAKRLRRKGPKLPGQLSS